MRSTLRGNDYLVVTYDPVQSIEKEESYDLVENKGRF
jgi:hypothetical protein